MCDAKAELEDLHINIEIQQEDTSKFQETEALILFLID